MEDEVIKRLDLAIDEANREEDFEKLKAHVMIVYDALVSNRDQLSNGAIRNEDYFGPISVMIQKYVTPIVIVTPNADRHLINNGTGVFLELDQKMLITNEHVLTACKGAPKDAHVLIGGHNMAIEDFVQVASKSSSDVNLDLAVIKIPENLIEPWVINQNKLFYKPESWPLQVPQRNNMVFLAGYPGVLRENNGNEIGTFFACIQDQIMDVDVTCSIMNFNRDEWVKQLGVRDVEELTRLGGFSGGPMFLFLDGKLILLGIVRQGDSDFFDMQFVHTKFIRKNGEICEV